ncbi:MAG: C-GCAxxG-C-C family protein [Desulfobulbaceae bacterium]|jgi:C_GCAxxG_C_C family probable redox protein|nr:C-GCAxxG-C-C family protein [Desulfobulbaceae bacterium]
MKSKVNEAVACFNSGFNCSQSILSTYCEEFGLDKKTALKIASGFGGGMGRLQETCGAVLGAYLLIGLKHGHFLPEDRDSKEKAYALIQEFAMRFKERNKTTNCRELLGVDFITGNKQVASERVKKLCPKMVQDAAEIIEQIKVVAP